MTYNEITEIVNEKLRENTRILKNGEIHCCKRNDEIGKEIYAIIPIFEGNKPEFDVVFREECAGYEVNQSFDNVYEFVNEFKKIINAVDHVSELANSLVIF